MESKAHPKVFRQSSDPDLNLKHWKLLPMGCKTRPSLRLSCRFLNPSFFQHPVQGVRLFPAPCRVSGWSFRRALPLPTPPRPRSRPPSPPARLPGRWRSPVFTSPGKGWHFRASPARWKPRRTFSDTFSEDAAPRHPTGEPPDPSRAGGTPCPHGAPSRRGCLSRGARELGASRNRGAGSSRAKFPPEPAARGVRREGGAGTERPAAGRPERGDRVPTRRRLPGHPPPTPGRPTCCRLPRRRPRRLPLARPPARPLPAPRGPGTRTPERKEGAPAAAPHLPRSARPRRRLAPRPQPPRPPGQRAHTALGRMQRSRARGRGPRRGSGAWELGGAGEGAREGARAASVTTSFPARRPVAAGEGRGEGRAARAGAPMSSLSFSPPRSPPLPSRRPL